MAVALATLDPLDPLDRIDQFSGSFIFVLVLAEEPWSFLASIENVL